MGTHSAGLRTVADSADAAPAAAARPQNPQTSATAENRTSASDPQNPQHPQGCGLPLHPRDPRLARLLRWGWPVAEAEALAARLARRDALAAAGDADDRVTCVECSNYRHAAGRCAQHKRAGLQSPEVGRELAETPQRCPAYKPADAEPQTHKR